MDDINENAIVQGYMIKQISPYKDKRGFALAENPDAPSPFVTWQYTEKNNGERDYYWARYFLDEYNAKKDFITRSLDYMKDFSSTECTTYRYYAENQRLAYNTYPRENGEPIGMVAFSGCAPVEYGSFNAWGYIEYDKPLPDNLIYDYGLRAAPGNPDVKAVIKEQGQAIVQGYEIKRSVLFEDNKGIALAENLNAPDPYVTWQFSEDKKGVRDYYWGNYASTKQTATMNYEFRISDYHRQNGVSEKNAYKYYSTQRPVDIATYPKTENGPVRFENFDKREEVEQGQFRAWGYLVYDAPLTAKQIYDYELRPAPDNFNYVIAKNKHTKAIAQKSDITVPKKSIEEQTQVVGLWEEEKRMPDDKRYTWHKPSIQGFALREPAVTPEQLERRYNRAYKEMTEIVNQPAPKPIMEQLAQAAKKVTIDPPVPVDKKPDRDER